MKSCKYLKLLSDFILAYDSEDVKFYITYKLG
jgi:hypothetical protein